MTTQDTDRKTNLALLALAALGIVYGDIGTSPLYAFKEAFTGHHALAVNHANVLATLSALFWSVMLIVSIKYVWVMLRFDNEGEGGVLALTAMAHRFARHNPRWATIVVTIGVFAAALFYGDAIITPAISVLSAVEGMHVATPNLHHLVVPITMGIIIGLFMIQRHGTGKVGGLFGPITLVWFVTLAILGLHSIIQTPAVLQALNPMHALEFAYAQPGRAFIVLAAVFLALTGGEALYADMGHFGARAVRVAWYGLVCPALLINYFGQGALVLRSPEAVKNPFYLLAPDWLLIPMVILATAATIIASQATITGAFSITLQASRLGYLPRLRVLHTSDVHRGQIYIPSVNWLMLVMVLILVAQFESSGALAAAYGIAVSGTMIITTTLTLFITLRLPKRLHIGLVLTLVLFGLLECLFLGSNLTKLGQGGWLPVLLGLLIFIMLTTWKEGTRLVGVQRREIDIPMKDFLSSPLPSVPRVPGTAVYLTSDTTLVPSALFHNLKHYKVMHERTIFLHVKTEDIPYVARKRRLTLKKLGEEMYQVTVHFGFREEPDVPKAMEGLNRHNIELISLQTSYFVARSTIIDGPGNLPHWRAALYAWMTRQSEGASTYYNLPPNSVVELGTQVIL
ncbi:MAG: potassium transporter Kup [Gammaproteobacteria bacterium]|nr:potassium transporter Kup [Gammaproteobacteria bacterium]